MDVAAMGAVEGGQMKAFSASSPTRSASSARCSASSSARLKWRYRRAVSRRKASSSGAMQL